jgi:hypothetical protein
MDVVLIPPRNKHSRHVVPFTVSYEGDVTSSDMTFMLYFMNWTIVSKLITGNTQTQGCGTADLTYCTEGKIKKELRDTKKETRQHED